MGLPRCSFRGCAGLLSRTVSACRASPDTSTRPASVDATSLQRCLDTPSPQVVKSSGFDLLHVVRSLKPANLWQKVVCRCWICLPPLQIQLAHAAASSRHAVPGGSCTTGWATRHRPRRQPAALLRQPRGVAVSAAWRLRVRSRRSASGRHAAAAQPGGFVGAQCYLLSIAAQISIEHLSFGSRITHSTTMV